MCRLSRNLGALTSWNLVGLFRPVMGQLYVYLYRTYQSVFQPDHLINHLTPNDHYMGRTAQLTSRCCILYIYSTSIRTEYFKHAA